MKSQNTQSPSTDEQATNVFRDQVFNTSELMAIILSFLKNPIKQRLINKQFKQTIDKHMGFLLAQYPHDLKMTAGLHHPKFTQSIILSDIANGSFSLQMIFSLIGKHPVLTKKVLESQVLHHISPKSYFPIGQHSQENALSIPFTKSLNKAHKEHFACFLPVLVNKNHLDKLVELDYKFIDKIVNALRKHSTQFNTLISEYIKEFYERLDSLQNSASLDELQVSEKFIRLMLDPLKHGMKRFESIISGFFEKPYTLKMITDNLYTLFEIHQFYPKEGLNLILNPSTSIFKQENMKKHFKEEQIESLVEMLKKINDHLQNPLFQTYVNTFIQSTTGIQEKLNQKDLEQNQKDLEQNHPFHLLFNKTLMDHRLDQKSGNNVHANPTLGEFKKVQQVFTPQKKMKG